MRQSRLSAYGLGIALLAKGNEHLVKLILLSPEPTLTRKIKEAILSTEISRRYTKEQILELYLNQIYYGNLAYGIDAAAHTYFNKEAKDLTLGEASMLAGLPQLPAAYDPYTNRDAAEKRQAVVLSLVLSLGPRVEQCMQLGFQVGFAFDCPPHVPTAFPSPTSVTP